MRLSKTFTRHVLIATLLVSIFAWSVVPATAHAPKAVEAIQEHLQMVSDHGHSHATDKDIYWMVHGHSHDAADHDHSHALLLLQVRAASCDPVSDHWRLCPFLTADSLKSRIERPPRL